jgi:hypothetical protein
MLNFKNYAKSQETAKGRERERVKTPPSKIKGILKITLTSLIAALACTGIIYAATTVGTNISTDGILTVNGNSIFSTASSTGIVKFSQINSDTGAISFGDENLTTTGTLSITGLTTLGNASTTLLSIANIGYIGGANGLILSDGSITDASGAISFGNENLTTTGTLNVSGLTTLGNASTTVLSVTGTATNALLVEKADGTAVFVVDTTNANAKLGNKNITNSSTIVICSNNASYAYPYLELCDYVTDGTAATGGDEVEIQAAVNSLANKGGIIQFFGRFFVSASITLGPTHRGIHFKGVTSDTSITSSYIQLANGANTDLFVIDSSTGSVHFIYFSDLLLAGGKSNNTAGSGIVGIGSNSHDLYVMNTYITGFAEDGIKTDDSWGLNLESSIIEQCDGVGLRVTGGFGGRVFGNKIMQNGSHAIMPVSRMTIASNELGSDGASAYAIYFNNNTGHVAVTGNVFVPTAYRDIFLPASADYISITGNVFNGNSVASHAIEWSNSTNNIVVSGNSFISYTGYPYHNESASGFVNSCNDCVFEGNSGDVESSSASTASFIFSAGVTKFTSGAGALGRNLYNGYTAGETKDLIFLTDGGGNVVITVNNFKDGATITMDDAGDVVRLMWSGSKWITVMNSGATVAP